MGFKLKPVAYIQNGQFLYGENKDVTLFLYEELSGNNIVLNPTFTIANATITIYESPNLVDELLSTPTTITPVAVTSGWKLAYKMDSAGLVNPGLFIGIFKFDLTANAYTETFNVEVFLPVADIDTGIVPEPGTFQYNDQMAQSAVGSILADSATIDFTYVSSPASITASVKDASIGDSKLVAGIDAAKLSGGGVSNTVFDYLIGVSSAIQTQIDSKQASLGYTAENTANKNQVGGYAGLDGSGVVASAQSLVKAVFGRTGNVAAATNDYTWAQIDKTTSSIADITTKSHTLLSDIGTLTHAQLETAMNLRQIEPSPLTNFMFDDFMGQDERCALGWTLTGAGTAAVASSGITSTGIDAANRFTGAIGVNTGTTASGRTTCHLGTSAILFGHSSYSIEFRIYLPILSDAVNEYTAQIGFIDSTAATDQVDGFYAEYNRAVTGVNWQAVTANNSTRTTTNTGTAVVAATPITVRFDVNAAGTSATMYINGALVATNALNIPTGAGRHAGIGFKIIKSVGSGGGSNRELIVDYFKFRENWSVTR